MPATLVRALDLSISHRVDGLYAGEHASTLLGDGTELAQVRPYQPGDDVRRIDWNVTARTTEPHVRLAVAERTLDTWLVLDASASMWFGTADRRKSDVAEGVALAIARVATRHGGRLAVVSAGGRRPVVLPPQAGRSGVMSLLTTLREEPLRDGVGIPSLGEALRRVTRLARRRSLVVVVSDYRGERDWLAPLRELASRAEVMAVEVRDPREQELPGVGVLWLVDPETGRQLAVDTNDLALRERFAAAAAAERRELATTLRSARAGHIVLSTSDDWLRKLVLALRLSKRRAVR